MGPASVRGPKAESPYRSSIVVRFCPIGCTGVDFVCFDFVFLVRDAGDGGAGGKSPLPKSKLTVPLRLRFLVAGVFEEAAPLRVPVS